MTKRILAIVLALAMSLSLMTAISFAAVPDVPDIGNIIITENQDGKTMTVTWNSIPDTEYYTVQVYRDGVSLGNLIRATSATAQITPNGAGSYSVQVTAYNDGKIIGVGNSGTVTWTVTTSGSGSISMTVQVGATVVVKWKHNEAYAGYAVEFIDKSGNKETQFVSGENQVAGNELSCPYKGESSASDLSKINIYPGSSATSHLSDVIGSWTNSGSSTGGNTGGSGVQIQGNINVSINGSNGVVTWDAVPNASDYTVTISNNSGSYPQRFNPSTTSATFDYYSNMAYNIIVSATVKGQSSVIGVAEIAAGSGGSSIGGTVVATRPSSNSSSVFLQWTGNSAPYLITYSASGYGSQMTQVATTNYITLNCDPNYSWVFTVSSLTNGSVVGYAALNRGSSSSSNNSGSIGTTGSLTISRGLNSSVVSWPSVSGATGYIVTYKSSSASYSSNQFVSSTSFTVPYGSSETWTVTVQALYGNQTITVGSATVTPSGITQGGSTSSSNTTQGNNCTVTSYDNYAVLSWSGTGRAPYTVIYYLNGNTTNGQMISTNSTSIQLNISRSYSYVAIVLDSQNRQVAYVSVKGSTSTGGGSTSGDITKTEIVNLTATPKNGWQTTISWNRRSDAVAYIVMYGLLGATASEDTQVIATSVDIPFSSSIGYQVYVYALTSTGRTYEVGHIYNVPGSTGSTDNDDDVKDYPTNFKATSGNEKITLSWDAADGASSYTIYYRRATSSKWLRAGTISRTAVNITGLTNGVDYEFKVTANGNDSGIVEIAPSATTSTTVIARDPADDNDDVTVSDEISLISVTSTSRGTITATWTPVSGATSYRVYVAEGASSTYRNKGTFTGTTAVISGLNSGKTYKVRVLKLPVEGDTATALAACDYMQVTVR